MSEPGYPGDIALRLPRPDRGLKLLLGLVVAGAVLGAVIGAALLRWLAFIPEDFKAAPSGTHVPHVWAFVTSGLLSPPDVFGVLSALLGLYFLTPELERRWGSARLFRFVALATALGNVFVLAASFLPFGPDTFRPAIVFGPWAAIAAITVAWAKENWTAQARFFGVIPMSGRTMLYVTLGGAVLSIFMSEISSGVFAPLGGVVAGLLFSGSPSPARAAWLRVRLGSMRRQAGGKGITVSDLLGDVETPRSRPSGKHRGKSPPLRVVQGGQSSLDDLTKRKLPKDKRYLN